MDKQKLAYDLALIYARTRFEEMVRLDTVPKDPSGAPQYLEDADTLKTLFSEVYCELLNSTDDYYEEIIEIEKALLDKPD